jgi:hypothetical protein
MRSPRALYSDKAPNWALGTINKCRQFRNISRYNSRWRQYLLLNYIIGCENLRIGPLLFLHYFTSTTQFTDYSLSSHFESFHSTVFWTRFGSSLLMCSSVSNLPVVYWVFILGDSGRRPSRLPREAVKKF